MHFWHRFFSKRTIFVLLVKLKVLRLPLIMLFAPFLFYLVLWLWGKNHYRLPLRFMQAPPDFVAPCGAVSFPYTVFAEANMLNLSYPLPNTAAYVLHKGSADIGRVQKSMDCLDT